jgi:uncharacterized OB-fold protein
MLSPVKIWRNQKHIASQLGLAGKIISWSLIRVPPDGFSNQAPYPIAIVELVSGSRILSQVVDWESDSLKTGQKVKTVVRRTIEATQDGVIPYGIKVKPI